MKLPIHKMIITVASEFEVHTPEHKFLLDAHHHNKELVDIFDDFPGMTFKIIKHDVYALEGGGFVGAFGFALTKVDDND